MAVIQKPRELNFREEWSVRNAFKAVLGHDVQSAQLVQLREVISQYGVQIDFINKREQQDKSVPEQATALEAFRQAKMCITSAELDRLRKELSKVGADLYFPASRCVHA